MGLGSARRGEGKGGAREVTIMMVRVLVVMAIMIFYLSYAIWLKIQLTF